MIASPDFPVRNEHAAMGLQRAFESYPAPVREGLLRRVAARLELPYRAHEYLSGAAVVDDGPIVEAALDPATPGSAARGAFAVIGPKTVGALIDRLFALREVYLGDPNAWGRPERQAERNEYGRAQDAIAARAKISSSRPFWNVPIRMIRYVSISWPKSSPGKGAMTMGSAPTSRPRRGRRW